MIPSALNIPMALPTYKACQKKRLPQFYRYIHWYIKSITERNIVNDSIDNIPLVVSKATIINNLVSN